MGYSVYLGVSQVPSQFDSFPVVNQRPTARNVTIDWISIASPSGGPDQDRFSIPFIIINQGDTVNLVFESNDTDDGHTFTITLPTSPSSTPFQMNNSAMGQVDARTGVAFTTAPNNCYDQSGVRLSSCNTTGGCFNAGGGSVTCPGVTAMLTAKGSFTVTAGIYRYRCVYHEGLGMYGWLVVLANKGFTA